MEVGIKWCRLSHAKRLNIYMSINWWRNKVSEVLVITNQTSKPIRPGFSCISCRYDIGISKAWPFTLSSLSNRKCESLTILAFVLSWVCNVCGISYYTLFLLVSIIKSISKLYFNSYHFSMNSRIISSQELYAQLLILCNFQRDVVNFLSTWHPFLVGTNGLLLSNNNNVCLIIYLNL